MRLPSLGATAFSAHAFTSASVHARSELTELAFGSKLIADSRRQHLAMLIQVFRRHRVVMDPQIWSAPKLDGPWSLLSQNRYSLRNRTEKIFQVVLRSLSAQRFSCALLDHLDREAVLRADRLRHARGKCEGR